MCIIKNVINLKLDAAESTFIIWATGINGAHHFVSQNFGDTLYKYSLVFARPLIYKTSISVLLFPYCEDRFSDLIILVSGFCSINGFGWHMVSAVQLIYFW